jgi:hypothetical protein
MQLAAEHEAAEVLRRMRLNVHAVQRGRYRFRWLFELLGWSYPVFPAPGRADDRPTRGLRVNTLVPESERPPRGGLSTSSYQCKHGQQT